MTNTLATILPATLPPPKLQHDFDQMRRFFDMVFQFLKVIEIRVLKERVGRGRPLNKAGYFDNTDDAIRAIRGLSECKAIYWTFNQFPDDLLAARANRLDVAEENGLTADKHITRRLFLIVDADPVRAHADISSTEEEHQEAERVASTVAGTLAEEGWPEPVMIDTGNGCQNWHRIDLPGDDSGLVTSVLASLQGRFGTPKVKIDQTVFNPARITKVPGSIARKGDNTELRPHRVAKMISQIESFDELGVVTEEQMRELVRKYPPPPPEEKKTKSKTSSTISPPRDTSEIEMALYADIERWGLQRHAVKRTDTGIVADLKQCPFDATHDPGDAGILLNTTTGGRGFKCFHDTCAGKGYHEFLDKVEPGWRQRERLGKTDDDEDLAPLEIVSAGALIETHAVMREPVIEGLLRRGEVGNLVAAPKTGKTWGVLELAVKLAIGGEWFGWKCTAGRVLLIDNELHQETIGRRLFEVAKLMGLPWDLLYSNIDVVSLRGRLRDVRKLSQFIKQIEPGKYSLVVLDSLYRLLPEGCDENSNSDITGVYNLLDQYAGAINSAFLCVHHSSKGAQGNKTVTDVGAGAGAQARAVDAHVTLRQHEQDDYIVVDAVARSFPPSKPTVWHINRIPIPHFEADSQNLRPEDLRVENRRKKDQGGGSEAMEWTPEAVVETFLTEEPQAMREIEVAAKIHSISQREIKGLLAVAAKRGLAIAAGGTGRKPLTYSRATTIPMQTGVL